MFEDFKNQVQAKQEKQIAENFLATAQPIPKSNEEAALTKALSPNSNSRLSKVNTYRYKDAESVIEAVMFEYPDAAFVQIVNLDKKDIQGYPEVSTRKVREVKVTASSVNTYWHGKITGAEVKNVSFSYRLVLVFVKDGEYKMLAQNINGQSNRSYY
jgi:DNA-binding TFAR19-related protein (PDSD5 family)